LFCIFDGTEFSPTFALARQALYHLSLFALVILEISSPCLSRSAWITFFLLTVLCGALKNLSHLDVWINCIPSKNLDAYFSSIYTMLSMVMEIWWFPFQVTVYSPPGFLIASVFHSVFAIYKPMLLRLKHYAE
jgi:hypothetical protein